jgi:hypothetical protein
MSLLMAHENTKVTSMMRAVSGKKIYINYFQKIETENAIARNVDCALFIAHVRAPISFWTSGAADGDFCAAEQVYGWCSNGTRVKRQEIMLPWADANPPEVNQSCLSLILNNSQFALDDVECAAEKHVICEVNIESYLDKFEIVLNQFLAKVQQSSLPSHLQ